MGTLTEFVRRPANRQNHLSVRQTNPLLLLLVVVSGMVLLRVSGVVGGRVAAGAPSAARRPALARLSDEITVHAADRGIRGSTLATGEKYSTRQRAVATPPRPSHSETDSWEPGWSRSSQRGTLMVTASPPSPSPTSYPKPFW